MKLISHQQVNLKRASLRHIIIKNSKIKDKIFKAAREKKAISRFLGRNLEGQGRVGGYIDSVERRENLPANNLSAKVFLQKKRRDKDFPNKTKGERVN